MNKESWQWLKQDLEILIGQPESLRLEFKSSRLLDLKDKKNSRSKIAENLSKEVSGLANTEGGTIVIGIEERREGKSRLADRIKGVDVDVWSPEQLQQLIESNLSPYLTGLRIKRILIDDTASKCAFVISVPQGNTAYQASDRRYYSRSEYECKPLPDHEIRLRMFKGKTPSAILTAENIRESKTQIYEIDLVLENTGEINISEFKIRANILPIKKIFYTQPLGEEIISEYRDGWHRIHKNYEDNEGERRSVNIYPKDIFNVSTFDISFGKILEIVNKRLTTVLEWTIYLKDVSPIYGKIDLGDYLEQQMREKVDIYNEKISEDVENTLHDVNKFLQKG